MIQNSPGANSTTPSEGNLLSGRLVARFSGAPRCRALPRFLLEALVPGKVNTGSSLQQSGCAASTHPWSGRPAGRIEMAAAAPCAAGDLRRQRGQTLCGYEMSTRDNKESCRRPCFKE